ncbi:MAG: hypothetical protein AAFZ15_32330, partial [Bacteroidota bacterium]
AIYQFLKNYCTIRKSFVEKEFIKLVEPFLSRKYVIRKFYSENCFSFFNQKPKVICLYFLFSYFTKNKDLRPTVIIHKRLQPHPRSYHAVVYELLALFNQNLKKIKQYAPKDVYDLVERYYTRDEEVNYELEKDRFLELLKH